MEARPRRPIHEHVVYAQSMSTFNTLSTPNPSTRCLRPSINTLSTPIHQHVVYAIHQHVVYAQSINTLSTPGRCTAVKVKLCFIDPSTNARSSAAPSAPGTGAC